VQIKLKNYLMLVRFNKPIGSLLLMWPCWIALANINYDQINLIKWYLYFLLGAFLMRSAGCIINDLIDINIDKKIERTSRRPLASNKLSLIEAFIMLIILLIPSFLILMQFSLKTILFGLASVPLIIIYPFTKRFTNWPQIFLGIVFNWGVLIVSIEFLGILKTDFILLYIGCVFWTLAYDTIYAYQDRKDDIENKIKSTAVIFDKFGKLYVSLFYSIFFIIVGFLGYKSSSNFLSLIVIFIFMFSVILYLNKWNLDSKSSSNYYFKFNNYIGLFCFLFLITF
jgi:4-hydroxybenzoate polyprenyl transferase